MNQAQDFNQNMVVDLISKLRQHHSLDLSRVTDQTLWEKYKNNLAHFAVRDHQIVGCCVLWHDLNEQN